MRFYAIALLLCLAACERKPTAEELDAIRQAELARPSPSPKPGDWMLKDYKNPLEQRR